MLRARLKDLTLLMKYNNCFKIKKLSLVLLSPTWTML